MSSRCCADAAQARSQLYDLGHELTWAGIAMITGEIEMLADDPLAAEREMRPGYETLENMGETGFLSTVAAYLAEAVRRQGRLDEALALTEASERNAAADDFESQAAWRSVRARVLAARGETNEAERLAREAVALLEPTDWLTSKAKAALALADVLFLAGRPQKAVPHLEAAIRLSEQKGDRITAAKARALLARGETC